MPWDPHSDTRRVLPVAALAYLLLAPALLPAQMKKPAAKDNGKTAPASAVPKVGGDSTLTKGFVQARVKEIKDNESLKKEVKEQILKLYEDAVKQLDAAATSTKKLAEYDGLRNSVEKLTKDLNAEIARKIEDPDPDLTGNAKLADYEAQLSAAKAELQSARAAIQELEGHQKSRRTRTAAIPKRLEEAKKDLKTVVAAQSAKPPPNEAAPVSEAQRVLLGARREALEAEIKELDAELLTYEATADVLQLQHRAATRRVQRAERAVAFWTKIVERSRLTEAEAQERDARDLLERFRKQQLPANLIAMAETNLNLARRRTGSSGTVARIRKSVEELAAADKELQRFRSERASLEEKLKIPGIEDIIGPQLLRLRRQLPNPGRLQRRIAGRGRELSQVNLNLIREEEEAKKYAIIDPKIAQLVKSAAPKGDESRRNALKVDVSSAFVQRQKLLDSLIKDDNALHNNLLELNSKEQQLVNASKELQQLIDKHILWIPSTSALEWEDLARTRGALEWLLSGDNWTGTLRAFTSSVFARPLISALAVFLLALVLLKEAEMKSRLREYGDQAGKGFTEPYLLTVKALVLTVLISATWPAVLYFIGWHLETYPETTDFSVAVGNSLQAVGAVLFTLEFLRRMFRPRGLAEAHFRWRDARMQMFRSNLRWFALLALPGVFVFSMIDESANESYGRSLGRLTLMGLLIVGSGFLALVLRKPRRSAPSTPLAADHAAATKKTHVLRIAGYCGAIAFPIILAALAANGYLYTAWLLTWKLTETAWLSIMLIVLYALGIRWLYHARGKLALERVQEAAATAAAVAAGDPMNKPDAGANGVEHDETAKPGLGKSPAGTKPAAEKPAAEAPAATAINRETKQKAAAEIATINAQTKRLLRISLATSAVVGLWLIWIEVLPALKFLEYPLWSSQVEVTKMVSGPDGTVPKREIAIKLFTLGDAFIAIAVLVVAFIAATNLPGLLEVAVLQKLPIDSGARYAASTTARYGIYIIGIMWGFSLAGIGWSKVQWLVAALSVGIGFGLQEIVANFISGLILLFERPLRVGDVVTVGDVTGTVARIQIRATTVRDWDRKEYIIPNKELVTGKFMNWTLSDTVNRIVVNVGVAYGSDADLVQSILMDVVKSHPDVLESPEPVVTLEGFGDSSLNFVVRCCLPSLDKRLPTVHFLHAEIHRRLAKAGIEIPFPQRDLHIRSDDTQGNGALNRKTRECDSADEYESSAFS